MAKIFDYEEYLTRLADRKAADPERHAKAKAARRLKQRQFWDHYKEQHDMDMANAAMVEEVKLGEKVGVSRIRDIWHCIFHQENEQKWRTSPTLSQESRIKSTPRVRGCGAAAKRAGFAG